MIWRLLIRPALISLSLSSKQLKMPYNHTTKSVTLYSNEAEPLVFRITFNGSSLPLNFKHTGLCIERECKHRLLLDEGIAFNFKAKNEVVDEGEEVHGELSIEDRGALALAIKKSMKWKHVKLLVKHKDNQIVAVDDECRYPLFPPLLLTLSQHKTHTFTLPHLSASFVPDQSFMQVIGQKSSPFPMTSKQLKQEITTSIRDKIISIPTQQLLSCHHYAASKDFECEAGEKEQQEMGGLLFDFDPCFCGGGVQLHQTIPEWWPYHYSHIVLMCLLLLVSVVWMRAEKMIGQRGQ